MSKYPWKDKLADTLDINKTANLSCIQASTLSPTEKVKSLVADLLLFLVPSICVAVNE